MFGGIGYGSIDLAIWNRCNKVKLSLSDFGHNYHLPDGVKFQSDAAKTLLCGAHKFEVTEYEVFLVTK